MRPPLGQAVVSVEDVEAELQSGPGRPSAARNLLLLAGSLVLFVAAGAISASPRGVVVLVLVLLVHELGHLAAMRFYGYRDVQMFFIPLLGAAVSGTDRDPRAAQRALVALAGPVPGIALGIACAGLFHLTGLPFLADAARTALVLNTFNLLPLVPLDGGRVLEAALFSRSPLLKAFFYAAAGVAIFIAAVAAQDAVFGIVGILVLMAVLPAYATDKVAVEIKKTLGRDTAPGAAGPDQIPREQVARMMELLMPRLPEAGRTPARVAAAVRTTWAASRLTPPSLAASMGVLLLYVAAFGTGLAGFLGAEYSFQRSSAQWRVGGLYSVTEQEGSYRVAKILAVDGDVVSLRIYKEQFAARPTSVEPGRLTLGRLDDPEGFGIGHVPVSAEQFAMLQPALLSVEVVREDELAGYRIWKQSSP